MRDNVTAPATITATCIECNDLRTFSGIPGNADELWNAYACVECDHVIRLELDPDMESADAGSRANSD